MSTMTLEGDEIRSIGGRSGLPASVFLDTKDPEEAEAAVGAMLTEHHTRLRRGDGAFHAIVRHARLLDLDIAHFRYGAGLDIRSAPLDCFAFNFTLAGAAQTEYAGARVVAARGSATVFSPRGASRLAWSKDLELLCLTVPRAAMESHLRTIVQADVVDLQFEPGPGTGSAQLAGSVLVSFLRASAGGRVELSRAVVDQYRSALLSALLIELPHSASAVLRRPDAGGAERLAAAAVALMRDRIAEPVPIPRMAAELQTSVRALQAAFHDVHGVTPRAFYRRLRFEAVRGALLRASPTETTVTQIASDAAGFFHLGRFAGEYFELFAEHPVETLRRRG